MVSQPPRSPVADDCELAEGSTGEALSGASGHTVKKSPATDLLHMLLCRAAAGVMTQDGLFGFVAAATRAQGCQCCRFALTHNRDMKYLGCETVHILDILCHGYG